MKVAIVTSFPRDPDQPQGGVEAVSVNLVGALARRPDVEVHVVTTDRAIRATETYTLPLPAGPSPRAPSSVVGAAASDTAPNSFSVHRLPRPGSSLLRYSIGVGRRQVQDFLGWLQPDVVHAHDTCGLMVKGLMLPRVLTIHGFIHEDTLYQGGLLAGLRSWLWRWFEIRAWADAPHIVSISPYVRRRLRAIPQPLIHDIENPVAPAFFGAPRGDDGQSVLCAAHVTKLKNTLSLVKAFATLARAVPGCRLRLAGAAPDAEYAGMVRDLVAREDVSSRVDVLGPLSAGQVREQMSRAAVFALVSLQENAPMGIAEAMAIGVPVITSDRCGMPYMVRHGKTGFLVDPKNTQEIAARLKELMTDPVLRCRMGAQARKFAQKRFHPDLVAQRTVAVYRQVIAYCNPSKLPRSGQADAPNPNETESPIHSDRAQVTQSTLSSLEYLFPCLP